MIKLTLKKLSRQTTLKTMMGTFAVLGLLFFATSAFAGTGLSVTPNFPTPVTVGQNGVPVSLVVTNASTVDEGSVTLSSVTLIPSCGDSVAGCTTPDPDVFAVSASGTGNVGSSCSGDTFNITEINPATGEVSFARNGGPLVLAFGASCEIDFTVDVLKVPTADLNVVQAGSQTAQLGAANGTSNLGNPASGTGADVTTVDKVSPTITTLQNPESGNIGDMLNDTATVSGGINPTGSVVFKLFPPSDSTCTGEPAYTDTDTSAPYATNPGFAANSAGTWHWTADYLGDANNNATSSGCTEEPVTIVDRGHIIVDKITDPSGDPQSFQFTTTGTGYTGFNLTDAAAPNDQTLDAGTYSVAETAVSGWTQTSATCVSSNQDVEAPDSISLQPGETVTCTFTNTKNGHIIVDKITDPSGHAQSFDFTTTGTGYTGFSLTDQATPNDQELAPGAYSVAETAVSGWSSDDGICDNQQTPANITLGAGQTVTCTFTNTLQTGRLIVQKTTLPSGDTTVFTINATGTGTITGGGAGTITDADDESYEVTAGTYSVSETLPTGWNQTSNTCNDVVVGPGETKTCTITNTQVVEYCSPGYWKQSQHFDSWETYSPDQLFSDVFGENITISWSAKGKPVPTTNPTLLQALEANGGGLNLLVRATVGALLNSTSMNSGMTAQQVIDAFNAVYPGTNGQYQDTAALFTATHNCPLN